MFRISKKVKKEFFKLFKEYLNTNKLYSDSKIININYFTIKIIGSTSYHPYNYLELYYCYENLIKILFYGFNQFSIESEESYLTYNYSSLRILAKVMKDSNLKMKKENIMS